MSKPTWRPLRFLLPVLCAALLPGADSCNPFGNDDEDDDSAGGPVPVLLASGDIGPAGGIVEVTSGPKTGVKIDIPVGALSTR